MTPSLAAAMAELPIVAILRGVTPDEILGTAGALVDAGVRCIEVPLNSPQPFDSIERLCRAFGERVMCGAGTVLSAGDVDRLHGIGARLVVSPNVDAAVIARSVALGLTPVPGFLSATEALVAIAAGARWLKLFPAGAMGTGYWRGLSAVVPADVALVATGGVNADNAADWLAAGAQGLGIGADIYAPGRSVEEVGMRAAVLISAVRQRRTAGAVI